MSDDRELREALEQAQAGRKKAAAALEHALSRQQELELQATRAEYELEALVPQAESTRRELEALKAEVSTLRTQLAPEPQVIVKEASAPAARSQDRAMARFMWSALGSGLCLLVAVLSMAMGPGETADCSGPLGLFCVITAPAAIAGEGLRLVVAAIASMLTLVLLGVCVKAALGLSKGAVSSAS